MIVQEDGGFRVRIMVKSYRNHQRCPSVPPASPERIVMKVLFQFSLILLIWQIGEWFASALRLVVPGPIVGMLLLLILLQTGIVREHWIQQAGDLFLKVLPFFFVPSGVALLAHIGLIRDIWVSMTLILMAGAVMVMGVSGLVTQHVLRRKGQNHE